MEEKNPRCLTLPSFYVVSRKPAELKDLAPGTNPPFLLYNGTLKTDFIKIEEFLEQTLAPPRYPRSKQTNVNEERS